ncbi:MAG: antitoxin VapB family protein [Halobacteriales archaeon]|nr:antitoxin VapB family protein [Halobacteriales archaeon]
MGAKTIGLDEEAYAKLKAEKREGESFSDTVDRITDAVAADWRHSLGKYADEAAAFEGAVDRSREATSHGLARRQQEATAALEGRTDDADAPDE